MKTLIVLFGICLLMVSCSPKQVFVTDTQGYKYRLVEREKKLTDNISQTELWERVEPLDTNHWYSPTLASKFDTNNPPMFNSLMR